MCVLRVPRRRRRMTTKMIGLITSSDTCVFPALSYTTTSRRRRAGRLCSAQTLLAIAVDAELSTKYVLVAARTRLIGFAVHHTVRSRARDALAKQRLQALLCFKQHQACAARRAYSHRWWRALRAHSYSPPPRAARPALPRRRRAPTRGQSRSRRRGSWTRRSGAMPARRDIHREIFFSRVDERRRRRTSAAATKTSASQAQRPAPAPREPSHPRRGRAARRALGLRVAPARRRNQSVWV